MPVLIRDDDSELGKESTCRQLDQLLEERLGELIQEAHVAGVEEADVGDAVEDHGDALDAHAEGEAADVFVWGGVEAEAEAFVADGSEDGGVDHAAAEEFDPAGVFAFAAALAGAEDAGDLYVGGWLGEGEEGGEEAGFDGRAEEGAHGVIEGALKVGERNVGSDGEAFDLVEDGRVGGVGGVVAVHLAGDDDAQRRGLGDHGADLHGAGVGAHEQAIAARFMRLRGDLEGVLGVAGGVVFGEVEGFEVVEVGLDLRAELGGVAELVEDFDDAVHGFEQRVRDAGGAENRGQGDVDALRFTATAAGASRAASICCLSVLKRMPRGLRASGGAALSQDSEMSLRRPALRPSQRRRKASGSAEEAEVRTSSARTAKEASRVASS